MTNIDVLDDMKKLDPTDVLASTAQFADQCAQAWSESSALVFPDTYKGVKNVVVCGMGGSRFTPKSIKELYKEKITVPYEIVEDYTLPAYVNGDTLVILSSFSGTTEEVLACGEEAVKRGAKLTAVVQGGKVAELLKAQGAVGYIFDPKFNPCGQPRIGGGYLLLGHLGLLTALGLVSPDTAHVLEAIDHVRAVGKTFAPDVATDQNPAKQLAKKLLDTHPFIITAEFLKGFGNGFANQINETAKMISDYRYIPELNHHLMEGLKRPETLHQNGLFLFFRSNLYSDRVQKRFNITKTVVEKQQVKTHDVTLMGTTKIAQLLEAFALSGFVTFYMAMLYDTDPVAIPWVTFFKDELAK